MNALRIILSALLVGVAGWMMFDHALGQKHFALTIRHEIKTSPRLDDWQRRQDLHKEWQTFAQDQRLTWQLKDRNSWSLSGSSKTKDRVELFVSSWNNKEKERVGILTEDAQKEVQSSRQRKNALQLDLAWTEQSIQNIETDIQEQELSILGPAEDVEPAQMDDEPETEQASVVELHAAEMVDELATEKAPETQDTLEIDDAPQMDDEPESLSDVFSDLLQMDTTENTSSENVVQENISAAEDSSNESLNTREKPTSDLSELFSDILQSTDSLIEDNLTPVEENAIPGLDQIVGAIQSSTASINAQLGMSQEQSSSQAHGLKEDVSKITELQHDLSKQQMKLATLAMDLQVQQFEDLKRREMELWKQTQQEKLDQLIYQRGSLLNDISSFDAIHPTQPEPHELTLTLSAETAELPFSEIKHSYRFLLIGFALCFILNLFWEMALYRREI